MDFVDPKDQNDLEYHISYFDTLNEVDITHINISDFC